MTAFFLRQEDDRSETGPPLLKSCLTSAVMCLPSFHLALFCFQHPLKGNVWEGNLNIFLHHMGVQMKRLDGLLYHGLMEGGASWLRIHFCLCVVQSHKTMVRTTSLPDMRKLLQYKVIIVCNKFIGAALHCSWCLGIWYYFVLKFTFTWEDHGWVGLELMVSFIRIFYMIWLLIMVNVVIISLPIFLDF